jgi:hypothetical protein
VARKGGEIAGDARKNLERQIGRSVVTKEKASDYLPPADRWEELRHNPSFALELRPKPYEGDNTLLTVSAF